MSKLLYVGQQTADFLADNVEEHVDRYMVSGFEDLEANGDWRIPLSVSADLTLLNDLIPDNGHEAEVHNSMLVGRALAALTPSLARENRIWIRLSHIEGLDYSRGRWLRNLTEDKVPQAARIHFFASTWTQCRDDHALSRLWWNHRIASLLIPEDPEKALRLILSRADIRANLIERARIGTRLPLAKGIIRLLDRDDRLQKSEAAFRAFMKSLNAQAAGHHVEVLDENEIDKLISRCIKTQDS